MEELTPRCHDLVRLRPSAVVRIARDAPAWVGASLRRAPWAVVRRARNRGAIGIGIRGEARAERFASVAVLSEVTAVLTPEDLARLTPTRPHPAYETLSLALRVAGGLRLPCGAAGAAAYELACGHRALHDWSDLDLIVRSEPGNPALARFAAALHDAPLRIDAEVCFGDDCGVALEEALRGGRMMIKTPDGPRLFEAAPA